MSMMDIFAILNQKFQGKKTYTAGIVTSLSALLAYFAGDITLFESLQLVVPAILAMAVRHGQTTEGENAAAAAIISAEIASGKTLDEIVAEVEAAE